MPDQAAFSPIIDHIVGIQRSLRPVATLENGRTLELGQATCYPGPLPMRQEPPVNSWQNRWSLAAPPQYEPGYSATELWLAEMRWYGRSAMAEYDVAYREAGAVLDAALREFYKAEHTSLGDLVDTHEIAAVDNVIDVEADVARSPVIVTLNLQITRTVLTD
ncbi:MAG: hypothetical protein F4Z60_06890 [Chloroflexi bacterium]|nr:hypothetical protein [Chloroflexota bacterium]